MVAQHFGVSVEGAVDVENVLVMEKTSCSQNHCGTGCICKQGVMEHDMNKGGISC